LTEESSIYLLAPTATAVVIAAVIYLIVLSPFFLRTEAKHAFKPSANLLEPATLLALVLTLFSGGVVAEAYGQGIVASYLVETVITQNPKDTASTKVASLKLWSGILPVFAGAPIGAAILLCQPDQRKRRWGKKTKKDRDRFWARQHNGD